MREIQQLGKSLTRTEMKNLAGGVPPQTLWSCFVDGSWYAQVCRSVQPQGPCHYDAPCEEIGTCHTPFELCVY